MAPTSRLKFGDIPFQPGQQISPRYTILKMLGAGGMGTVYQAFDQELGVAVAIKVIRPGVGTDASVAKELETRFKRELLLARQVTHKHVVRIHDLGEIEGVKYLTMPFVEGETLAQVMARTSTLPVERVVRIAQQVAQGLAAAHDKGVIHRDLKPENIMLEKAADGPIDAPGDALIMDFGIARTVERGATQTAAGAVIGTLEYMAPEQAQGQHLDQRCDQYALGLILYDMLAGRRRFHQHENPMTEMLQRISTAPPSPRSINPDIPEPLAAIVMRLLDPSPNGRYTTTRDLVAALNQLGPDGALLSNLTRSSRRTWQLAAAAVVIVTIGGAAGWIARRNAALAVTAPHEPISVLIADFENKTGDPVFDGVVEQTLSLGIESASFVTAFPRRDALRAAAAIKPDATLNEEMSRLVALRENVSMVIAGTIEKTSSGYHINIRGLGPGNDPNVKYTVEDDATSKAEVLSTVGELAVRVREALGDTSSPADAAAKDTYTAGSLEAASAFAAAQELQNSGKREEAIKKYQEALQLDPEFGRAYSGIAVQYANVGRAIEAEHNYQEALKRVDRMTEREKYRTRGLYYMFAGKNEQAVREFTALLKAYPYDGAGLTNLALSNFYLRNFADATEHGRKAASLQPSNLARRYNLALYAMYAGQFETAIAESNTALEQNPKTLKALLARALSELALGQRDVAAKTYETLAGVSADGASFAAAGLADLAIVEGRLDDAAAILTKGIADNLAQKNVAQAAAKRIVLGEVKLARGDAAGAAKDALTAVNDVKSDGVRISAGLLLARAGRRAEAEALAAELEKRLEPDPQAYGKLIRAELAMSAKQPRAAIDAAREAAKFADTWLGHVLLGRAHLQLAETGDARREFEIAIKRQGEATALLLDDVPTYRFLPPVRDDLNRVSGGIR